MLDIEDVESVGIWTTVVEKRVAIQVRPGATLRITGISLPFDLVPPRNPERGTLRAVLELSIRDNGQTTSKATVTILIPEKNEHYECKIDLFPGKEYVFEVQGNTVHILGHFLRPEDGAAPANSKTRTRRIIARPLGRSASVATTSTAGAEAGRAWSFR
ncbi:hypothetical protein MD484_g8274, partial [Candolleomyces efflorescens]